MEYIVAKYILLSVLGAHTVSDLYRQAYELYFYLNKKWDFAIDSRYSDTTFSSDGPQSEYTQSNKHRVLIGRPLLLTGTICSFFAILLYF